MADEQRWPGTAEEYRELLDGAANEQDPQTRALLLVAAMIAGQTQVLDKIAYVARANSGS